MIVEFNRNRDIRVRSSANGKITSFTTRKKKKGVGAIKMRIATKTFDQIKPELVFIFNDVEYIDALIRMLVHNKKRILGDETPIEDLINYLMLSTL